MKEDQQLARKAEILTAALKVAERDGLYEMRRNNVAAAAGCSTGLVNQYYGTMNQLQRAVIRKAVEEESLTVIAMAAVNKNPHLRADEDLIKRALLQAAS